MDDSDDALRDVLEAKDSYVGSLRGARLVPMPSPEDGEYQKRIPR